MQQLKEMYSPTWPEVPDKLTFYLLLCQAGGDIQVTLHLRSQLCKSALGKPHRAHSAWLRSKEGLLVPVFTSQRNREKAADAQTHRARRVKGKMPQRK